MAHDVFISYAVEDKSIADAVCQTLEDAGVRCWYAPRDVPYTVNYEEAIVDALSGSKLMVLVLSSHSNQSAHVKREVQNACREEPQVPVLPFQVENVRLNKSLRYYIGSVNWLSALTPPLEVHLQVLVDYVQERLPHYQQARDSRMQSGQRARSEIIGKGEEVRLRAEETTPRRLAEEVTTPRKRQGKRAMLLIIIAGGALLALIAFILLRDTPEGGQQTANQTATPTSNRQAGQTTVTPDIAKSAPPGMVYVPGGVFTMGRNEGDEYERPAREVTVKPFFIDIYEVTNEDYAKFVSETNRQPPPMWVNETYPSGAARQPVTGVTWDDARAHAVWAGKRLPTEEEWEFAARGTDGRRYPWGNEWGARLANADGASRGMADVGTYKGASPFGAFDMVGNAWEWTASDMTAYPGGKLPKQPLSGTKVLRGGSYLSNKNQAMTTYRLGWRARGESSYTETGFRCVKDITTDAQEK